MQNDIACMRAYATSHQENALNIERIDQGSSTAKVKEIIINHFEDWAQITKDRCMEEWDKKEKFFLKLQTDYLEGELSK